VSYFYHLWFQACSLIPGLSIVKQRDSRLMRLLGLFGDRSKVTTMLGRTN